MIINFGIAENQEESRRYLRENLFHMDLINSLLATILSLVASLLGGL
jgi:hypothetical protein